MVSHERQVPFNTSFSWANTPPCGPGEEGKCIEGRAPALLESCRVPYWQAPSTPLPALQSLGSGVAPLHTLGQYLALPPALRGTPHRYSRLFIEAAYSIVIVLMLVTAAESAMI